jgi:hypothetical protein
VVTKNVIQPAVTLRLSRTTDRFFVNQVNFDLNAVQGRSRAPVPTKVGDGDA